MTPKLRVGLIGYGAWGKRIANTLSTRTQHCYCGVSESGRDEKAVQALLTSDVDFVAIATPFKTHAKFMRLCLERDIPFIVEKPAASYIELQQLRREFEKPNAVPSGPLMLCNHTLLFNPAIEVLKAAMVYQTPSKLRGEHGGPGPLRDDCSALLDYGAHGIALAFWLSGAARVKGLYAQGTPPSVSGTRSYGVQTLVEHLSTTLRVSNEYKFKRLKYTVETVEGSTYRFDDRDEHKLYQYVGPKLEALEYASTEPLTNALDTFALAVRENALGHRVSDSRFGWDLPMVVMATLESAEELVRVEPTDSAQVAVEPHASPPR